MIARRQPGPTLLQCMIVLAVNFFLILLLVFAVQKVRAASRRAGQPHTDAVAAQAVTVRPALPHPTPVVPKESRP